MCSSCLTLGNPLNCSLPGSSVHGMFQARILERVSFSRGSSPPRDWTQASCIGRWILYHWATWASHSSAGQSPDRLVLLRALRKKTRLKENELVVFPFLKVSVSLISHTSSVCLLISFKRYSLYLCGVSTPNARVRVQLLSRVQLFVTPWTVARQAPPWTVAHRAPLSMEFFRQEYWSGWLFPSSGNLSVLRIESRPPALQANSLPSEPPGKPFHTH